MLPGEDQVRTLLKQYRETKKILSSTIKPDTFFGRLNFLCDLLLAMQQYENVQGMFTKNNPSKVLNNLEGNIEKYVSDFVLRYMVQVKEETRKKKTSAAKEKYYGDSLNALISAFDCADKFWTGNSAMPHYTGPLFSEKLYGIVQGLWDEFCDKDFLKLIFKTIKDVDYKILGHIDGITKEK